MTPDQHPEVIIARCSLEKLYGKIYQTSQENPCNGLLFLVKL